MKKSQIIIPIIFAAYLSGCASVAPKELVDARSAYQVANDGPAQKLAPAELHTAKEALNLAEQSFQKDSDSSKTKDLAYVAQRKSEQAGAVGSIAAAKKIKEGADADFQKKQTEIVQQGKQDLSDSEKRTAAAQAEISKQAAVAQSSKELAEADKRTADAKAELDKQTALNNAKAQADAELKLSEKRTADALAELAAIASLKEEERGLVLTLSGSILFRSADSTLMSPAKTKLDQVAKALLAIRTRSLIVEGHTDSQGTDAYNRALSQRRADAVRDYLVQSGYPSNQIQARGQGENSPVAKNTSADGRANNRRVEIVIEREVQTTKK